MLQVQVSSTLAKGTKPRALQNSIQRKDATGKAYTLLCILFTQSPPPFFFKRRDYLKSEMSLIP